MAWTPTSLVRRSPGGRDPRAETEAETRRPLGPRMAARGRGTLVFAGATASVRGGAGFAAFAAAMHAKRALAQSLARELGPRGVHVAHVVIDGVIDSPNTAPWGEKVPLQDPAHLADAYVALHSQPPTVWSQEIMLSPQRGSIGMRL